MRKIQIVLICAACLFFVTSAVRAQKAKNTMTNADVVEMVKAGLSESTIVLAIQQSEPNFDTSTKALIELSKQSVSQKIMDAMLKAGESTTPVQQPQTNSPVSNPQLPSSEVGSGVVVFIDDTGRTEMKVSPSNFEMPMGVMNVINPFGGIKIKASFNGERARLRTTTTSPTFEANVANNVYPTDQIGLVKLTPKSDRREIVTGKVATFGRGSNGFKKNDVVSIAIEEIKEQNTSGSSYKRYSIKTVNPLPPGEYALVVSGIYYDFGVDKGQ